MARSIHLERTRLHLITGPDPRLEAVRREAEAALKDFRRDHNEAGLSQVHYVLAYINFRAGRMTELAATTAPRTRAR